MVATTTVMPRPSHRQDTTPATSTAANARRRPPTPIHVTAATPAPTSTTSIASAPGRGDRRQRSDDARDGCDHCTYQACAGGIRAEARQADATLSVAYVLRTPRLHSVNLSAVDSVRACVATV